MPGVFRLGMFRDVEDCCRKPRGQQYTSHIAPSQEDLVAKIDSIGRESRLKAEQLSMRTQMLDEQQKHNQQVTRERLDALSQVCGVVARSEQREYPLESRATAIVSPLVVCHFFMLLGRRVVR